jgi:hypothetical protein
VDTSASMDASAGLSCSLLGYCAIYLSLSYLFRMYPMVSRIFTSIIPVSHLTWLGDLICGWNQTNFHKESSRTISRVKVHRSPIQDTTRLGRMARRYTAHGLQIFFFCQMVFEYLVNSTRTAQQWYTAWPTLAYVVKRAIWKYIYWYFIHVYVHYT